MAQHHEFQILGGVARQALLHVLRLGAPAIIAADAGEFLEHTGRAALEIASWWPLAAASRLPGDESGFWNVAISVAGTDRFE